MDWIKDVEESLRFTAVSIDLAELKQTVIELKDLALKMPKMPQIIHKNKTYDTFSFKIIDTDIQDKSSTDPDGNATRHLDINHKEALERSNDPTYDHIYMLLKEDSNIHKKYKLVTLEITLSARFFSHKEILHKLLPDDLQSSAYEIIGEIIHLNLTDGQKKYKNLIGEVLHFKTGKTVINKTGKIEDTYRYYQSEILAGSASLATVHKENGVRFMLDLGEVYWCSRLQTERSRILGMVGKGEVVCDPFCGVGPHIIPALKKGADALCNDLNPEAIKWLKRTLELNSLSCGCVENMDASKFLLQLKGSRINHLIFNLPEYSIDYLKYADLFEDYWLHAFFFCKESEDPSDMIKERAGYRIDPKWLREVRKVSPSKSVFKLEVFSTDFFGYQQIL